MKIEEVNKSYRMAEVFVDKIDTYVLSELGCTKSNNAENGNDYSYTVYYSEIIKNVTLSDAAAKIATFMYKNDYYKLLISEKIEIDE